MSVYQPIDGNTPWETTVLTIHEDDLYPVAAYRLRGENLWRGETEGPEDEFYGRGRHQILYRAPTHWMHLPEHPKVSA